MNIFLLGRLDPTLKLVINSRSLVYQEFGSVVYLLSIFRSVFVFENTLN